MTKSKDKSEVEFLRAENRMLKKQVKHMKKDLSRFNKRSQNLEQLEKEAMDHIIEDEMDEITEETNMCPKCHKGKTEIVDLKVRKMIICDKCDYRLVIKK